MSYAHGGAALTVSAGASSASADAARILHDGLWNCLDSIDIAACRLPRGEMGGLFSAVILDSPELFHTGERMSFTYDRAGCVLSVFPTYTLTGEELTAARQVYADTVSGFVADLTAASAPVWTVEGTAGQKQDVPAWGEADTVLFIHEWMSVRYGYDAAGTRFDALSLFRDGVGVCQAYALAFLALARAAGVEAEVVVSADMDHAWNRVRVDGAWYHVDVTRDVRSNDGSRAVYHDRLLMSDRAAGALGYGGYDTPPGHECLSERYAPLSDALSRLPPAALQRVGGSWLTAADGLPCRIDIGDGRLGVPGDTDGDGAVTLPDLLLTDAAGLDADGVRALLVSGSS